MNNEFLQDNPLIILTGPTAVGKSGLSLQLAKLLNGEIISADSMQVYRGMDIGTAKLMPSEMQGIPHHLIDILDPTEAFDVTLFQKLAGDAVREISDRGHVPILVGGTGFYIQALLYGIEFTEEPANEIRKQLEEQAKCEEGRNALVEELRRVDPDALLTIHPNNIRRVIRAIEFYRIHGRPISRHNREEREKKAAFPFRYFVLTMEREELYRRIEGRVEKMLMDGLVDEVRSLMDQGLDQSFSSMQGIGYKEILSYLKGDTDYESAVALLKQNTRHYAKRQLTWFRRERDVIFMERENFREDKEILEFMLKKIADPSC